MNEEQKMIFSTECSDVILKAKKLLDNNQEWIERYNKYSQILKLGAITDKKQKFNVPESFGLYMNISQATGNMTFDLRYLGQNVAQLVVNNNSVLISTGKYCENNKKFFNCEIQLNNCGWKSDEAKKFRRHFKDYPKRTDEDGKANEEHRIESTLLAEFSKRYLINKPLPNIQPVKLAGTRFQMPTPLSASKELKYSGSSGGGIDILARFGKANAVKLCIIELKDENNKIEPPKEAIKQALAYATFIHELLRNKSENASGHEWWKIFGFGGDIPNQLNLYVVCAMPSIVDNDTSFANMSISFEESEDKLHLHYIYFTEITNIKINHTSLK